MTTKPFAYQVQGVRALRESNGRALIADSMGLGKTLQALLWVKFYYRRPGPVVVLCPAIAKEGWRRQAALHVGVRAEVLDGRRPPKTFRPRTGVRMYVLNYDILGHPRVKQGTWLRVLRALKPGCVIIDEIQNIRNPKTIRCRGTAALCGRVPHVIGMGGTAGMENCPAELFPALHIIWPKQFPSFWAYAFRHCKPRRNPWGGWEFKGAENIEELHQTLKACGMIRRLQSDVLKDLPPRFVSVVPVEVHPRKEYQEAERDLIRWLRKRSKRQALRAMSAVAVVKIGYLKRLAAELKEAAVAAWVKDFLEAGKKLILFGVHIARIEAIAARFGPAAVVITGKTPRGRRQQIIDRFNEDPACRLLVGNLEAAGTAWSCTSASTVAFFEFGWNPAKHAQAADRVRGVGRGVKGEPTSVFYLVAAGTIEERLVKLLEEKQKTLDQVLDGRPSGQLDLVAKLAAELLKGDYSWKLMA